MLPKIQPSWAVAGYKGANEALWLRQHGYYFDQAAISQARGQYVCSGLLWSWSADRLIIADCCWSPDCGVASVNSWAKARTGVLQLRNIVVALHVVYVLVFPPFRARSWNCSNKVHSFIISKNTICKAGKIETEVLERTWSRCIQPLYRCIQPTHPCQYTKNCYCIYIQVLVSNDNIKIFYFTRNEQTFFQC